MDIGSMMGQSVGLGLSGIAYLGSLIRGGRVVHPEGEFYHAMITSAAPRDESLAALGTQLQGPALVRLSAGLWRGQREWPDVLGCAIRLGGLTANGREQPPQDLVLGTFRSFFTMGLALITTNTGDYFANDYHSAAPFRVDGLGAVKFRLHPVTASRSLGRNRRERLASRVAQDRAAFWLEVRRTRPLAPWVTVARLRLIEAVGAELVEPISFSPFHSGRGIAPLGFVNGLRRATYQASYWGRRGREALPEETRDRPRSRAMPRRAH